VIFSESAARLGGLRRYKKARSYVIESGCVDSAGDVEDILLANRKGVSATGACGGPRFLECITWPVEGHVGSGEDDDFD
jgi:hypothetical protein